jgi:ABC-type polysaccharide/polyol phosphate transport system ATPase subunit
VAAIELEGIGKRYRVYHQRHQSLKEVVVRRSRGVWEDRWALRDVSFEVPHGQTLGVIGDNGAGKSTLLKLLTGIVRPDRGRLATGGRISSLLELGAGFQQEYTGRENVYLNGVLLGLRRTVVARHFDEIVAFSELEDVIDNPVKNYSTGMRMRLGFAVAVHLEPEILLLDEVLAVGDASFQQKCFAHMRRLREEGRTILLVSHDLDAVRSFCERAIWLDQGRMAADGPSQRSVQAYLDAVTNRDQPGDHAVELDGLGRPTGEVEITSVRFLDGSGTASYFFQTGETMAIEVGCRAGQPLSGVAVTVNIVRVDGLHCVNANTALDEVEVSLPAGEGTILVEFPRLMLRTGRYDLDLVIYESRQQRALAFHHRRHPFTVRDGDSAGGVAQIDHTWHVRQGAPAAAAETR